MWLRADLLIVSVVVSFGLGVAASCFLRRLLPLVSEKARLQLALRSIHRAAQAYREEFPVAFNDPGVTWEGYAIRVLEYARQRNPRCRRLRSYRMAERCFLNFGFVDPPQIDLIK